jgi:hypothetical protein
MIKKSISSTNMEQREYIIVTKETGFQLVIRSLSLPLCNNFMTLPESFKDRNPNKTVT